MYTLDKLVTIEKNVADYEKAEASTPTWETLKETYAKINYKSGSKLYNDGYVTLTHTEIIIRYDEDVTSKCRIKYGSNIYVIQHIKVPGRKDWMVIDCTLLNEEY